MVQVVSEDKKDFGKLLRMLFKFKSIVPSYPTVS